MSTRIPWIQAYLNTFQMGQEYVWGTSWPRSGNISCAPKHTH